jgi:hypothetical protein
LVAHGRRSGLNSCELLSRRLERLVARGLRVELRAKCLELTAERCSRFLRGAVRRGFELELKLELSDAYEQLGFPRFCRCCRHRLGDGGCRRSDADDRRLDLLDRREWFERLDRFGCRERLGGLDGRDWFERLDRLDRLDARDGRDGRDRSFVR